MPQTVVKIIFSCNDRHAKLSYISIKTRLCYLCIICYATLCKHSTIATCILYVLGSANAGTYWKISSNAKVWNAWTGRINVEFMRIKCVRKPYTCDGYISFCNQVSNILIYHGSMKVPVWCRTILPKKYITVIPSVVIQGYLAMIFSLF